MKIFLFSALLFCVALVQAQQFKVDITNPVDFKADNVLRRYGSSFIAYEVTHNKMQLAYTFKLSKLKFGIKLMRYSANMKLIKDFDLSNGERAFGPVEPFLKLLNNKLYLIYFQAADADMSDLKVFAGEIDTATMNLLPAKELLVINQKSVGLFKSMDLIEKNSLNIVQSPDLSKVLAMWSSGLNNEIVFSVLDPSLNLLWTKSGTVNTAEKILLTSSAIDNNETVFAGCKSYIHKDDYEGHVLICRKKINNKDITVTLPEGHPYEVYIVPSAKNNVISVVGLGMSEKGYSTGAYNLAINGTTYSAGKLVVTPLTQEVLSQLHEDGWANTKGKSMGSSPVSMHAFELENGSINMVGEFRRSETVGRGVSDIAGSILLVQMLDKNVSFVRIPKYRVSAGSRVGDSFRAFGYNNKIIVFYNDNESNLKKSLEESPSNSNVYKNNVLIAATIAEGEPLKREKIVDLKDDNFLALPEMTYFIAANAWLAPCVKIKGLGGVGNQMCWATISLP